MHLRREAVFVQAVLLLVAADARQFGEAEAAAHSGQFGLGGRRHSLTSADALLLIHWNNNCYNWHHNTKKGGKNAVRLNSNLKNKPLIVTESQ